MKEMHGELPPFLKKGGEEKGEIFAMKENAKCKLICVHAGQKTGFPGRFCS